MNVVSTPEEVIHYNSIAHTAFVLLVTLNGAGRMSNIQISLNHFMATPYSFPSQPERSPLHERIAVVGLVVLAHAAAFAVYWLQPERPAVLVNEMSVSFANMQMQQADVIPKLKPKLREPDPVPAELPAPKEEAAPVPQNATPPSPVVLDAEPDYRADYLNNPRPPYPMVARRMGYHGKVVLNVEVLAEGKAGQVLLHQSSGHDILDNAAIQTVKTWRFTPARRLGQSVTQWFLVPIKFSLEDNAG
jgi:periplasmic protein TonB